MSDSNHKQHYIAVDLGAESGRVLLGGVSRDGITVEEVHRFPEHRHRIDDRECWDVAAIEREIDTGVKKAVDSDTNPVSVSVDSWGVDYVRLDERGNALADPFMYREPRTTSQYEGVLNHAETKQRVYATTGIQFLPFNSIYQWMADGVSLGEADRVLMMSDYFNWRLTGSADAAKRQEVSQASTSQAYNPQARQWAIELLAELGVPTSVLPELVDAGTTLAPLKADLTRDATVQVVATCSHDTGAAVAATPLAGEAAYLSSGTWSLLGVELPSPILTDAARAANFTNEIGFGHSVRFLKNLSGLFILQECRRVWKEAGRDIDYGDLAEQAADAKPLRSLIRPDADVFATVGDMPARIAEFCRSTNQPVPETPGQFARCVYESLALLYGETIRTLSDLTGRPITKLNIVGGGSQSDLLNQLAADATGLPVEAGPVEATGLGNIGVQAIAAGQIKDLAQLRDLVRLSFHTKTYTPAGGPITTAAGRFTSLKRP